MDITRSDWHFQDCTNLFCVSTILTIFIVTYSMSMLGLNRQLQNYNSTAKDKNNESFRKLSISRKHVICPLFTGRAGNQMFQFASSYGIAKFKGMGVVIDINCSLLKVFNLNVDIRKNTSICSSRKVKKIQEAHACTFDKRLLDFNNTSDVQLTTHLQSYMYFAKYEHELRKQYTFKGTIQTKAIALLDTYLKRLGILRRHDDFKKPLKNVYFHNNCTDKITLIGVHIRRGDYVTLNPALGYNVATKEYLHKSVDQYMSMYSNLIFVVASNEINWAKANMPRNIKVIYLEGHSEWLDLAIITLSEHFICTVGTFSWWAGWLTGGNVTYFKWPAIDGTPVRKSYSKDFKDFYYEKWIGL